MLVWIIRHGKAERSSDSGRDEDRALKPRGRRQAAHLGAEFAGRDDAPARLLTSPFTRAPPTAETIAETAGLPVQLEGALESGRGPASVLTLIESLAAAGTDRAVALVGHNPELSQVIASMAEAGAIEGDWLRTGQAVGLEIDAPDQRAMIIDVIRLDED